MHEFYQCVIFQNEEFHECQMHSLMLEIIEIICLNLLSENQQLYWRADYFISSRLTYVDLSSLVKAQLCQALQEPYSKLHSGNLAQMELGRFAN